MVAACGGAGSWGIDRFPGGKTITLDAFADIEIATRVVERVAAAFIGALIVGLIGLIPVLGWIFVFALTLAGAGAITTRIFRPTFFAPV